MKPEAQTVLMTGTMLPNGNGGFVLVPKKPTREITSKEAAQLLNMSRSNLRYVIDSVQGGKYLRWRWLTAAKGKRVFELDSVLEYMEASKDPEFGET